MTNRALIIGISQYTTGPLQGPPNDVAEWKALLESRDYATTVLSESAATRDAIETAFKKLLDEAQSGDRLVLYCSSHGTRTSVRGTRVDGIVAFSAGRPTEDDIVFDFELRTWIHQAELKRRKIQLTIIADCCHAAGFISAGRSAARQPAANDAPRFINVRGATGIDVVRRIEQAKLAADRIRGNGVDEPLLLAATSKENVAYEGRVNGGTPRGLFSFALAEAVRRTPTHSYADAMKEAHRDVSRRHNDQQPAAMGPRQTNPFLT